MADAKYMQNRRKERREALIWLAGEKCVRCGGLDNLQFDHFNPRTKLFVLSGCHLDKSWEKIFEEFKKCQLLCHPCHRSKTIAAKETGGGHNKIENPRHGTAKMYHVIKCKCSECITFKRLYRLKKIDSLGNLIPG